MAWYDDPLLALAMAVLLAGIGLLLIGLHRRAQPAPLRARLLGEAAGDGAERQADNLARDQGMQLPPRLQALLLPIARVGEQLAGSDNDKYKLRRLLAMAGFRSRQGLGLLMAGKLSLGVLLAVVVLFGLVPAGSRLGLNGLAGGLLALFAGSTLPELWLRMRSARRGERLARNLPDALDLMVICAEAGLPLGRVLQVVSRSWRCRRRSLPTSCATPAPSCKF